MAYIYDVFKSDVFKGKVVTPTETGSIENNLAIVKYGQISDAYGIVANTYDVTDLKITKVVINGPATIVFFSDDTKVVVKRAEDDQDSLYTAVAYAFMKKIYGNNSHFKKVIDSLLVDQNANAKPKNDSDPITCDILKDLFKDFKIEMNNLKHD